MLTLEKWITAFSKNI